MKKLFVYYSYTGSGKLVADRLAAAGYDVREIVREKPMPKSFFWGILVGGFLATIKHKDKIAEIDLGTEGYDEVVIGSPVWNARFASPVNTALSCLDLSGKKVTFVLYSGSGEAKIADERIAKEYPNATVIHLKEPKKFPEELGKLSVLE